MKRSDDDDDCVIDFSNRPAVVPPGEYDAIFLRHETAMIFKSPKVFFWFRIVSPGAAFELEMYRPYRVAALVSKAGRGGKFKLKAGSDLAGMLFRVNGVTRRLDRISPASLKGAVLRVRVRTVTHNHRKEPIPEALQYSVIDDVLGKETGE